MSPEEIVFTIVIYALLIVVALLLRKITNVYELLIAAHEKHKEDLEEVSISVFIAGFASCYEQYPDLHPQNAEDLEIMANASYAVLHLEALLEDEADNVDY